MYNFILQIETVGPQGDKLIWVFLILVIIGITAFILTRKNHFSIFSFRKKIIVTIQKNKVYHPSVIQLNIENKSKKAIVIEHPVIRFKSGRKNIAFKIKAVNARVIYPLFLEIGKTHQLPVALEPFYDYNPKLKKFSRLRIEFKYDKEKQKKTRYLLLKPTFFRSER